jgi:hypothetical protein
MAVHEARTFRWVIEYLIPAAVGPFLLLVWHPGLLSGTHKVPKRSYIGLLVLSTLIAAHLGFGWSYGVRYQGKEYTITIVVLNVVATSLAWVLLMTARTRATFPWTLVAHAFVAAWLVWIAFPWLGELP